MHFHKSKFLQVKHKVQRPLCCKMAQQCITLQKERYLTIYLIVASGRFALYMEKCIIIILLIHLLSVVFFFIFFTFSFLNTVAFVRDKAKNQQGSETLLTNTVCDNSLVLHPQMLIKTLMLQS